MNNLDLMKHVAVRFHNGQLYGDKPYTHHLEVVGASVKKANPNDERLEMIAWGHDILEDTTCTAEVLFALFDDDVVKAIVALTKIPGESYELYMEKVRNNPLAREVKKHDTFCNMRESLYRGDMKRVKKYAIQLAALA